MRILHICAGWQEWNGAANIARMIMDEQRREGDEVSFATWARVRDLRAADEVWIHCGWLPCLWWAALWARKAKWMPEACYDPVRLKFSAWKKRLVGPIERWALRRCEKIIATCEAEKGWIKAYLGQKCLEIEVTDVKRFFDFSRVERVETCRVGGGVNLSRVDRVEGGEILNRVERVDRVEGEKGESSEFRVQSWGKENSKLQTSNSKLNLLYLGRRHPLKGVEFMERAVYEISTRPTRSTRLKIELKIVSNAFGEELEKVWEWCDVLVLPTLSENFGLVVAEALERGKRVITTDGAPVWGEDLSRVERVDRVEVGDVFYGYDGRLIYLKGYRDGSDEKRVELLQLAIMKLKGL